MIKGSHHTDETRAKMRGRTRSDETRANLSRAHLGQVVSAETRAKISAAFTGEKHPRWKGGRTSKNGYVTVGHDYEHRLVARPAPDEVVHHINGDKQDNRPENLVVMTRSSHSALHARKGAG